MNKTKKCTKCKKVKDINSFNRDRARLDGRYTWCKVCKKEHNSKTKGPRYETQKTYNKNNKDRLEEARLRRQAKRRALLESLKSVPCADCNNTFPPVCMDFDHVDPLKKTKDVSQIQRLEAIIEEADKCDVVCSNCHRLRTFSEGRLEITKQLRDTR